MRILKIASLVVIVLVILFVAVLYFMPSGVRVERNILIDASPRIIYGEVNDLKNWEKWDPFSELDTTMTVSYSEKTDGIGAWVKWNGKDGSGKLTVLESEPELYVKAKLEIDQLGDENYNVWTFNKTDAGIKVSWLFEGNLPLLMRFMRGKVEAMIGPIYEKGLQNLKAVCEKKAEEIKPIIEYKYLSRQYIYAIKDSSEPVRGAFKLAQLFAEITEYIKKTGDSIVGSPLAIYYSVTYDMIVMKAAFPIYRTGEGTDRIQATTIPSGNVVTATHYGSYSQLKIVHDNIIDYITTNNYQLAGQPWEVYITDPLHELDSSKWETQIFYPVF